MSYSFANRFISESELEEQRKLYGTKEKDDIVDNRTLFEKLQEQKRIKEEEIAERTKFNNDDIEYFQEKDKIETEKKRQEQDEIENELDQFRKYQSLTDTVIDKKTDITLNKKLMGLENESNNTNQSKNLKLNIKINIKKSNEDENDNQDENTKKENINNKKRSLDQLSDNSDNDHSKKPKNALSTLFSAYGDSDSDSDSDSNSK
ncbi:hypothetical protein DLAC_05361 [Tieghemostelium lacteum]|uniref:FAM192A/Fyv6 N-terminal domain-containing protein n=1 Tax=Tieghemostelium lacteum TaxID=361077 RepID=A0A151ZFM8_TIELA|nr:hypothetical protein DLAC_05361 [Tieghemostelium lacteum]|eukprot:KYQ92782.1 hypothetical protein DLAC_05361 [Tieghemostelium lacteum]